MEQEIQDQELVGFCQWYKVQFGKTDTYECVMLISMSGYFHTIPRKARRLLQRCQNLNLLEIKRNVVNLK